MPKLTVLAPAKINLTFDIRGTMPDGYHEVETILHSIDLADRLIFDVQPAAHPSVEIVTNDAGLPLGEDNLITKAALAFCKSANTNFEIKVQLQKHIPVGAGLAGGSADAAATLMALNTAAGKRYNSPELLAIGATVGADVPFCIIGGTKYGTARGDQLAACDTDLEFTFCIFKPRRLSISTPWAYAAFDKFQGELHRPRTADAIKQLRRGKMDTALLCFGNVFQSVIFSHYPELAGIHAELLRQGAWYAQLSGSGPAIFAIDPDLEHAHFLRRKLFEYSDDLEIHFCQSTKNGVAITEYEHGKATC
jgi:4-diphosphocytidyl-2-C-methyl-D-erythritol kinase